MAWLGEFGRRALFLFRRGRFDRDLQEEMRFHLDMRAEEEREGGTPVAEASHAARRAFGNQTLLAETTRDAWGWGALERFAKDVRFAFRMLWNNPGFTAVVLSVLSLGIGANTAIFTVVNSILLHPFPFPGADRVVALDARHSSGQNSGTGYRVFLDWREQNGVFEELAIWPWTMSYTLTGQGEPQRIVGAATTHGFLRVLNAQPLIGRFFTPEEDRPGAPRVALLSYSAWQQRFGGRPDILGRSIVLDDTPYTIIGVMPSRLVLPGMRPCDFWRPLREDPANGRNQHQYEVIARIKQGVTLERAQADMSTIAARLAREYPATDKNWSVAVMTVSQAITAQAGTPIAVLLCAVAAVLLLACANVAGLMLARASGRAREIAIRASIGASRMRIVRQMLTESTVLALCAGGLGLGIANWLTRGFQTWVPSGYGLAALRIDSTVLWFTLGLSLATGLLFGLVPALYGSRTDLNAALKGGANAGGGARSRTRLLSGIVAGEVALSVVLLAVGTLLAKDLLSLFHANTGIRMEHVLTFALDLPQAKYGAGRRAMAFYDELLTRLREAPGTDAAGGVGTLPMSGGYSGGPFEIEGRPKPADWMELSAQYNNATPGYFRSMGIPLLRGRDFDSRDTANSQRVAIIDEALARRFFPHEDPLGRRIRITDWLTIVGIAGSVKHNGPAGLPSEEIYVPYEQAPSTWMCVTVRTVGNPANAMAAVRGTVRSLDRDVPVLGPSTMRQVLAENLSERSIMASLLAAFAAFAVGLAAIGIYGVIAYAATQRTREMGIRIALGASYADVLGMVVRKGVLLAGTGVSAGMAAALASSRVVASVLAGTSSRDVGVFAGVAAASFLVALAASYIPARRAAKVDPVIALRCE